MVLWVQPVGKNLYQKNMTSDKNFPTYPNGRTIIPITVERKFLAQFLRSLNDQIVKRMVRIRRLCEKLPFCSMERRAIMTRIVIILSTMCESLFLSFMVRIIRTSR